MTMTDNLVALTFAIVLAAAIVLLLFHLMPQLAAGARMPPRWCRKSTVSEDPTWSAGVGWCGMN